MKKDIRPFELAEQKRPRSYGLPPTEIPNNFSLFEKIDWQKPVVLELGCGTGMWSLAESLKNPQNFYMAIERTHQKFKKLQQNLENNPRQNLLAIQADGIYFLAKMCADETLDEIQILYPNPYPKKDQANKRFFTSSSLWVLLEKLKPNGRVVLVSNIESYVNEAKDFLEMFSKMKVSKVKKISQKKNPRTLFEKKYLERGEAVFEMQAVKEKS